MLIYKDIESGDTFSAADAAGIVSQMHAACFSQAKDDFAFMLQTADRVQMMTQKSIRHESPEEFLSDLVAAEFLQVESSQ
jgi:hypothetical protein